MFCLYLICLGYLPCSVDYYLANASLFHGNSCLAPRGSVTEDKLSDKKWLEVK